MTTVYAEYLNAQHPTAESATKRNLTATATNQPVIVCIPSAVRTTDSCACGHIGDCDYPDCQNGAYHGTSPLRFITIEDHHVKPLNC